MGLQEILRWGVGERVGVGEKGGFGSVASVCRRRSLWGSGGGGVHARLRVCVCLCSVCACQQHQEGSRRALGGITL